MKEIYRTILVLTLIIGTALGQMDYESNQTNVTVSPTLQPTIIDTITIEATETIAEPTVTIKIQNFTFHPQILRIYEGTTIIWINLDDVAHTATSNIFDSGPLNTGYSFDYTFDRYGTYKYRCNIHLSMPSGQINVIKNPTYAPKQKVDNITAEPTEVTTIPTERERNLIEETVQKERPSPGFESIVTVIALILTIYIFRKY